MLIFALFCGCSNKSAISGYIEGEYTYLSTQTSGQMLQLFVQKGQWVHVGDPLFTLEADPQFSAYQQAKAQVEEAKASLENLLKGKREPELAAIEAQYRQELSLHKLAQVTVSRYTTLYQNKFIQKETLDQAIAQEQQSRAKLEEIHELLVVAKMKARVDEIAAAEARLTQVKENLNQAAWTLKQKRITAPREGLIVDRYYRAGEVIAANQPVLSLLTEDNVYALFFVPEQQLSTISLGQPIEISCDSCKQPIRGRIRFISPEAEFTPPVIYSERTRTKLVYRVEADFIKPAQTMLFHPGQPITIRLLGNDKP